MRTTKTFLMIFVFLTITGCDDVALQDEDVVKIGRTDTDVTEDVMTEVNEVTETAEVVDTTKVEVTDAQKDPEVIDWGLVPGPSAYSPAYYCVTPGLRRHILSVNLASEGADSLVENMLITLWGIDASFWLEWDDGGRSERIALDGKKLRFTDLSAFIPADRDMDFHLYADVVGVFAGRTVPTLEHVDAVQPDSGYGIGIGIHVEGAELCLLQVGTVIIDDDPEWDPPAILQAGQQDVEVARFLVTIDYVENATVLETMLKNLPGFDGLTDVKLVGSSSGPTLAGPTDPTGTETGLTGTYFLSKNGIFVLSVTADIDGNAPEGQVVHVQVKNLVARGSTTDTSMLVISRHKGRNLELRKAVVTIEDVAWWQPSVFVPAGGTDVEVARFWVSTDNDVGNALIEETVLVNVGSPALLDGFSNLGLTQLEFQLSAVKANPSGPQEIFNDQYELQSGYKYEVEVRADLSGVQVGDTIHIKVESIQAVLATLGVDMAVVNLHQGVVLTVVDPATLPIKVQPGAVDVPVGTITVPGDPIEDLWITEVWVLIPGITPPDQIVVKLIGPGGILLGTESTFSQPIYFDIMWFIPAGGSIDLDIWLDVDNTISPGTTFTPEIVSIEGENSDGDARSPAFSYDGKTVKVVAP